MIDITKDPVAAELHCISKVPLPTTDAKKTSEKSVIKEQKGLILFCIMAKLEFNCDAKEGRGREKKKSKNFPSLNKSLSIS